VRYSKKNITKHHKTPQNITKHHKTSQNTTKHHKTPQNITKHHKTPQNITKHHKTSQNIFLLLLLSNYFYFKNSQKLGQEATLCTEEEILVAFLAFE
jgi:hypothetical protein